MQLNNSYRPYVDVSVSYRLHFVSGVAVPDVDNKKEIIEFLYLLLDVPTVNAL